MFSDGEEEVDGEDAEMEDDGEEQGEGDEAAEKVFDQSDQVTSERFEWIKQWDFVLLCFQRKVVKMRRRKGMKSGICSWPGRCWRWLRSFTKGVETVYDRLLKYKLSTE